MMGVLSMFGRLEVAAFKVNEGSPYVFGLLGGGMAKLDKIVVILFTVTVNNAEILPDV